MPLRHWDIFCRVVDNFGDIGVSWRLARQLAHEHGAVVRLWVDNLESLRALCPEVYPNLSSQVVQGIVVGNYGAVFPSPADVVIEAFGCGLPSQYVSQMAVCRVKPLWIVLEYLSAEAWVSGHHGLPSPHPQLDLPRYFFFPGVSPGTGGVLREADLLQRREAFDANAHARRAWWEHHGFDDVAPQALSISLFAYPYAPWRTLLTACEAGNEPVVVAIPAGAVARQVRDVYCIGNTDRFLTGALELRFIPFVAQTEFDTLLWASDVNFVRGEDSFVRAQWAGRPFIWHIYPQAERAHEVKLAAFMADYCSDLPEEAANALRGLWLAWNGVDDAPPLASAWREFMRFRKAQVPAMQKWQARLLECGDLVGNLVKFCRKMIQFKAFYNIFRQGEKDTQ